MNRKLILSSAAMLSVSVAAAIFAPAFAQGRPDTKALIAAQKQAMAPLAYMDGEWRGTAITTLPDGSKHSITQTERIGPLLDGSVRVIEGRGHEPDGRISFNAFGIVYFDSARQVLRFQAHAMGMSGDYSFTPTADGYIWEIPAGPVAIRYTTTIHGDHWHEVGDRIMPGMPEQRFFEMNLKRIGDSTWPAAGAVAPK